MTAAIAARRLVLEPNWLRDPLYASARSVPSLDLRMEDALLRDSVSGQRLITFTRASPGTYVGSDRLIKSATTNLLLRSEEFDNASWTKNATAVTANAATSPSGAATADALVEDTSTGVHNVVGLASCTSGAAYTFSVFVKTLGALRNLRMFIPGGVFGSAGNATFNLTSGDTAGIVGPVASQFVEQWPGGWYRCGLVTSAATATFVGAFTFQLLNGAAGSYTGDGTSGIYLWGAQLEEGSTATEYLPTGATINSAPRITHDPTTGRRLGLLVEEARTNLMLRSEEFDNASWTVFDGAKTVTSNSAIAPNGIQTADTITADGTTRAHFVNQTVTLAAVPYAFSVYAKAGTNNFIQIRFANAFGNRFANYNVLTGETGTSENITSSSIDAVGNGWYRCRVVVTPTPATATVAIILVTSNAAVSGQINTLNTSVMLWGAQLEAGSFATSYIPTTDTAVTHEADIARITGANFSSWYRQGTGTIRYKARTKIEEPSTPNPSVLGVYSPSSARLLVYRVDSLDRPTLFIHDGTSQQLNLSPGSNTWPENQVFTGGVSWDTTSATHAYAGGVATGTIANLPTTLDSLSLAQDSPTTIIDSIQYWPARLPDSTLQYLTR